MENSSFLCLVLLVAIMGATTGLHLISAAKPPPFPSSISLTRQRFPPTSYFPPLPPSLAEIQKKQLNIIIDALIGAGDFAGWINLLSSTNPSSLPLTATLFVPSNDAISRFPTANAGGMNFDPFIVPYHIVPQRLSFSDLQQFPILTRLPTLFPSKFIVITNTSRFNFTLDDSLVTHPDILVNAAFSVHGINKVLDCNVYGGHEAHDNGLFSPPPPPDKTAASKHMPRQILMPPSPNDPKPVEGTIIVPPSPNDMKPEDMDVSFGVARLCNMFFIVFLVFCAVFCIQDSLKFPQVDLFDSPSWN